MATVLPLRQSGLGLFLMAFGSSSGLKGDILPSKGSVSPSLGIDVGTGALPGAGSCSPINGASPGQPISGVSPGSPSCGVWPGSPVCGISLGSPSLAGFLLFFPFLGFCGLGSFLGLWVFTCFAFLGFFLGGGPMDPPSPPSGPSAEHFFGHAPRSSSLSGSSSGIVASSGEIMHLRMTIFRPPSSSMGSLSELSSSTYGSMAVWRLKPCFCLKFSRELIDHPVSPLLTNQGSPHPRPHAVVGKPFHKTSRQMNL